MSLAALVLQRMLERPYHTLEHEIAPTALVCLAVDSCRCDAAVPICMHSCPCGILVFLH